MPLLQNLFLPGVSAREVFLFGAAVVVSLLVALLAWRHRRARGAFSLMGLMLANAVWTASNVVMLAAAPPLPQIAFYMADVAYFTLMPFLVLFVLEYSGYSGMLTPARLLAFWAVPILFLVLTLTNPWHGYMYTRIWWNGDGVAPIRFQEGPGFTLYIGYSYVLIGICLFLMFSTLAGKHAVYRRQVWWVMAAALLVVSADVALVFGVRMSSGLSWTPLAIAGAGVIMAIALTRRTLFDLVPVAQAVILETLQDSVLVVDAQGRIVEMNRAAQELLGLDASAVGRDLTMCAPKLAHLCAGNPSAAPMALDAAETRFADARVSPLHDYRGIEIGRILALHDVTEHKRLEDALAESNALLEARVAARTRELETTIAQLQKEIAERERVETSLRAMEESLAHRVADQSHKLAALYDVILFGGQDLSIEQVQAQALTLVMNVMHADAGCVLAYDSSTQLLSVATARGLDETQQTQLAQLSADWLVQDRVPRTLLHIGAETDMPSALRVGDMSALLSAPAYLREMPIGALLVFWYTTPQLAVEDIALFSAMADQLAILIENARWRERAQTLAVQQERRRLARDLHDSVTQSLHSLVLTADVAQNRLRQNKPERLGESLAHLASSARQALLEMRLMLYELRLAEPAQLNLVEALRLRLDAVERRAGIETELVADSLHPLPQQWNTDLYAIAMEALNNSLKHAHASHVSVHVHQLAHGLEMDIADDGCGMNCQENVSGGIGLSSMRERAERLNGKLLISSDAGHGTRVHLDVEEPL